jgi:hypothetical protein
MSIPRAVGYIGLVGLLALAALGIILTWSERDRYGLAGMAFFICLIAFFWHQLLLAAKRERDPLLAGESGLGWHGQSVWALVRGPIAHTPQGLLLIIASVVYVAGGLTLLLLGDNFASLAAVKTYWGGCVLMPVLLLMYYVNINGPDFGPSAANTIWGLVLAVTPIAVVWLIETGAQL